MTEAELLAGLPGLAFAFALVLSRVGVAVMLLPGLGEADPPPTVRAGLALAITLLLLPAVAPAVPPAPPGLDAARMVLAEVLAGGALGWLARLPAMALTMAGSVVSYMTGLTSILQQDPALGGQSAVLGRAMGLAAPVIILSTGLYALPLNALAGSYQIVPPGAVMDASAVAEAVQQAASASFGLAIQLSAPFILAGLLFQSAMGLLARLIPQLQVYSAAMPGQILGGLALAAGVAAPMLAAWSESVRAAWLLLPGQ